MNSIVFNSLPINGPLRITSGFGYRNTGIQGASVYHPAVDIGGDFSKFETPILSVADGVVEKNYWDNVRGWVVIVNHGKFQTLYQHLKYKCVIPVGTVIKAGHVLGIMGNTSTTLKIATHLHFELIYSGKRINPEKYLRNIQPKIIEKEVGEELIRYAKLEDVPGWAKPTIKSWIDKGLIAGDSNGNINLSEDMVRMIVITERRLSI